MNGDTVNSIDTGIADELHAFALGHPGFVAAMQVWTDVFQPWTFRAVLIAVALWLLWRRRTRPAVWVLVTVALCGLADSGLKALIGRPRPHWTHPVSTAAGASFPSGHSLTSAMGCAVLLSLAWPLLGRRGRWLASAVATLVPMITGFTRLGLGVHYLSDVVGGWLIAVVIVAATTLALRPRPARPPA